MPEGDPSPEYDRQIRRIRSRLDLPDPHVAYDGEEHEDPVQLSVRLSPRLRHDVAEVARRRGVPITTFVTDVLEDAVRTERDPFAGLAADLAANLRAELAHALESGEYAKATAEVDRAEGNGAGG